MGTTKSDCINTGKLWSWREELNLQPVVYKTTALPIELRQPARLLRKDD